MLLLCENEIFIINLLLKIYPSALEIEFGGLILNLLLFILLLKINLLGFNHHICSFNQNNVCLVL